MGEPEKCTKTLSLCNAGETVQCDPLQGHPGPHEYAAIWATDKRTTVQIKWEERE